MFELGFDLAFPRRNWLDLVLSLMTADLSAGSVKSLALDRLFVVPSFLGGN